MPKALLISLAVSSLAFAQEGAQEVYGHQGFHLRGEAGLGFLSSSDSGGTLSGLALHLGASLGGAIVPNLIIAGAAWVDFEPNPSFSTPNGSGTASGATVVVLGLGPEIVYYFMPANLYLSAAAGVGNVGASDGQGNSYSTNWGLASKFAVGKEWKMHRWGLGISGSLLLGFNSTTTAGAMTTVGGIVAFSASLN